MVRCIRTNQRQNDSEERRHGESDVGVELEHLQQVHCKSKADHKIDEQISRKILEGVLSIETIASGSVPE